MTYRAGIIGAGGVAGLGIFGRDDPETIGEEPVDTSHAGGYAASDAIELVAVADVDAEKLATFGEVWDVPESERYANHEAMLRDADLDVVSVCTPTVLHADHVVDAAEIGDPELIWAEKPLAASVAGGERAIEACEETDTELLVNHSMRFTDRPVHLRELIREDEISGEVRSAGGVFKMELVRNSTHLLDLLVFFLDLRPRRVAGYVTGENEAADALGADRRIDDAGGGGFVVGEDGAFVTVDCTTPRDLSTLSYRFVGTEGKLRVDEDGVRYWEHDGEGFVRQNLEVRDAEGYEAAFQNAAEHAVDLIEGRAENRSPGTEALRAVRVIVGFYLSHHTDSQIEFPLADPLRDVTIASW